MSPWKMKRYLIMLLAVMSLVTSGCYMVDPANPVMIPLKVVNESCDLANIIVNDLPTNYYPDYRPFDEYNFMVRHMGPDAGDAFVQNYSYEPFTGFDNLGPNAITVAKADVPPNQTSAFSVGCNEVATFINSGAFEHHQIDGGGPHTFYEYLFSEQPAAFVDLDSDLVMQAYVEVPWVMVWGEATGQIGLGVNLIDTTSGKNVSWGANIFDNRWDYYEPYVWHDGQRPFFSSPLVNSEYMTVSPYSAGTSKERWWDGLRFYRIHLSPDNLIAVVSEVNDYCALNPTQKGCDTPYSLNPLDYVIVRFGVGNEVTLPPNSNISMGTHVAYMELYRAY